MSNWVFWDWVAYACLLVGAVILAMDAALRNAPEVMNKIPKIFSSRYWAFAPLLLVIIASVIFIAKEFGWIDNQKSASQLKSFNLNQKLEKIVQRQFLNQTVKLDGFEFIDCYFDNVTFIYEGKAPFFFTNSKFKVGSKISFASSDPAINLTVDLLAQINKNDFRIIPYEELNLQFGINKP